MNKKYILLAFSLIIVLSFSGYTQPDQAPVSVSEIQSAPEPAISVQEVTPVSLADFYTDEFNSAEGIDVSFFIKTSQSAAGSCYYGGVSYMDPTDVRWYLTGKDWHALYQDSFDDPNRDFVFKTYDTTLDKVWKINHIVGGIKDCSVDSYNEGCVCKSFILSDTLSYYGIENYVAISFMKGKSNTHAFVIANIDGKWFPIDSTISAWTTDKDGNVIDDSFFNEYDDIISKEHYPVVRIFNEKSNYYSEEWC